MLEEINRLLDRIGAPGPFATRGTAAANTLNLTVEGVGRIRFPITAPAAQRLAEVARPARHGFKDQTRLDPRVRDTGEIPRRRISIGAQKWERTLAPQLERIRRELGLPEGCRLTAKLHNMLVYAPGQFFVPHQDSEKTDDMIGTLVVSLPSRFTGGEIVIEHHDERRRFGGSATQLTFIAFYADCRHEVRPVKQGYRVVLTYNLTVKGDVTAAGVPAADVDALARQVRKFFETPLPPRWSGDRQGPPDRLVYLLDHQYTQRGLAWNRLKSADAECAAALREVARRLDCEIFLALADVHETWECEDEYVAYGSYGYRRGWRAYDADDADDADVQPESSDPALIDLIESTVELRHWVDTSGRPEAIAVSIAEGELCYTKPSVDCEPFASEHEGYTGNEGGTVDRWYHRAAVVLWPRERTFVIRAKASPRWAIAEITKTLDAGRTAEALALAQRLLPFWAHAAVREATGPFEACDAPRQDRGSSGARRASPANRSLAETTLRVAAQLDDAKVAAELLQPFTLTGLTPKSAPQLAELLSRYGLAWCRALLRRWTSAERDYALPDKRLKWVGAALPALCRALCARDTSNGPALAHWILAEQWAWVLKYAKELHKYVSSMERTNVLADLCRPVLSVIESSRIAKQPDLHRQAIDFLTTDAAGDPVTVSVGLLRAARKRRRPEMLRDLGLKPVHAHCVQDLTARLRMPARADDDWSITTRVRCSCALCATLTRFLRAPDRTRLEWPLAKPERAHVHGIIDDHHLPVTHTTRRTGRPYTLVLEKTDAIFERDADERERWQSELQWLTTAAGDF